MNDPTKRIEVEKSSLLSLKVEVLKKQEEIRKRKEENPEIHKIAKKQKIFDKIKGNESKKNENDVKTFEIEDSNELAKSKRMLEAKAKYYERMSKGQSSDNPCSLVLFSKKIQNEHKDDLVEYTDCFGRSRKVKKDELEKLKEHDVELTEVVEERLTKEEIQANFRKLDTPSEEAQMFFQKQKEEWRKTEEINKDREEIFYSNVLFDEARTHGVSYYGFSQDADERKEQQERLQKMREATEEAQQKRMAMKSTRDTLLASRVEMAKKRLRDKGIVVEDKKEETNEEPKEEVKTLQKDPEIELQREMERRAHIRPWDKNKASTSSYKDNFNKSDDDWRPQKEKMIMTQDEWVEKQRSVRNSEFAPVYEEPKNSVPRRHPTTNYKNMEDSIAAGLKFMKKKFGANKD